MPRVVSQGLAVPNKIKDKVPSENTVFQIQTFWLCGYYEHCKNCETALTAQFCLSLRKEKLD